MKSVLKIFVTNHCPGCAEAQVTATRIKQDYPHLAVELIDLDDPQANIPEAVLPLLPTCSTIALFPWVIPVLLK
ncbi:MAG: hypothetical protein HC875_27700 [Anaerolineales bacterium]|nr:hypothetical protein [Anaerolineales bacterium]